MTREEFERINNWSDLIDIDYDYNLHITDNVYTQNNYDDIVNDRIDSYSDWRDKLNYLIDIPRDSYDVFIEDDYDGSFQGSYDGDAVFEDYKDQMRTDLEDNNLFDDNDDDVENNSYEDDFKAVSSDAAKEFFNRRIRTPKTADVTFEILF